MADTKCIELNERVIRDFSAGQVTEAENKLSAFLTVSAGQLGPSCGGLILNNLAGIAAVSGQLAEAELLADRSVHLLKKAYPGGNAALLRPLHILASTRLEQGKIAKAREAFQQLQAVAATSAEERALVHGIGAALLHVEGRRKEAESEYLLAIGDWKEAGRANSADMVAALTSLAMLYVDEQKFGEAHRIIDQAGIVLGSATDVVVMDRTKLLNVRAVLDFRLSRWREAEDDLRQAIALVEGGTRFEAEAFAELYTNYAIVLRKLHRGREARSVEKRVKSFARNRTGAAVVDATELRAAATTHKR